MELLSVPPAPLAASAGAIYGLVPGSALVLCSGCVSAAVSFQVGRAMRERFRRKVGSNEQFRYINRAISRGGECSATGHTPRTNPSPSPRPLPPPPSCPPTPPTLKHIQPRSLQNKPTTRYQGHLAPSARADPAARNQLFVRYVLTSSMARTSTPVVDTAHSSLLHGIHVVRQG